MQTNNSVLVRFVQVLTRPSAANSNFPYHVRTSQIGVMREESEPDVSAMHSSFQLNLDRFPHHAYAPTLASGGNGGGRSSSGVDNNGGIYAISHRSMMK